MRLRCRPTSFTAGQVAALVNLFAAEFDYEDHDRTAVENILGRARPSDTFEMILDNPAAALFRLTWRPEAGPRVGYWPFVPPGRASREEQAERLTTAVLDILREVR